MPTMGAVTEKAAAPVHLKDLNVDALTAVAASNETVFNCFQIFFNLIT